MSWPTATGCNPRLVLEWLNAQAASGYVELADGTYRLPEEQALALAVEDSPVYVAGGAGVLAALFLDKDKQVAAMRGDGAVSWGDHHPCLFDGTERFFRPGYKANLVPTWLPALDGVTAKLEAARTRRRRRLRARRVDGVDGRGVSRRRASSASTSTDRRSTTARERAAAAAVVGSRHVHPGHRPPTTTGRRSTSSASSTACTTWATRSARPAMRTRRSSTTAPSCSSSRSPATARGQLQPGRADVLRRVDVHLHAELVVPGRRPGLGAQAGEARLRDVFTEAGFTTFRRATETPFNLILEARK